MVLDRDSQNSKIYFDRQNLAPYLKSYPTEQNVDGADTPHSKKEEKTVNRVRDEADAAAGGASVLDRVSSFSILPRSSSSITLTATGGGTTPHDPRGRMYLTPTGNTLGGTAQSNNQQQQFEGDEEGEIGAQGVTPSWSK